jgi:hypothetical protein
MGVLVLQANPSVGFYKSLGFECIEVASIRLGVSEYREQKMVLQIAAQQVDAPELASPKQ